MEERIRAIRRALNLTQQELADKIGVMRNTIAGYEIGRRTPTKSVISLLCKELGVSETWLRTGEGEMFPELSETDEFMQLMGKFMKRNAQKPDKFTMKLFNDLMRFSLEASEEEWDFVKKTIKKWASCIDEDE